MSPWAKAQPASAPGTDTSKLEELARLPGISPQLAALLQDKERVQDILAKDPAARSALARAAGAPGAPAGKAIEELRGILGRYLGERKTSAESIANRAYAKQKEIAALKKGWATIKAALQTRIKKADGKVEISREVYRIYYGSGLTAQGEKLEWISYPGELKYKKHERFYDALESVGGMHLPDPAKDGAAFSAAVRSQLFTSAVRCDEGSWRYDAWDPLHSDPRDNRHDFTFKLSRAGIDAVDARINAMCNKAQVEVDKLNQEFKDEMHMVNSARGDLRDLSRDITSLGKGF